MKRILISLFVFFLFVSYQNKPEYPYNKFGRPSKYGIQYYVSKNQDKIISEFQKFTRDTLYDVYITVDNLDNYGEEQETLGLCITSPGSSEIIVTNQERYLDYEVALLKKFQHEK